MIYEAILFDMDGVVIDTHQSVTNFWRRIAKRYQIQLTESDFDNHIHGCPATHTLDVLFPCLDWKERQFVLKTMANYETNLRYSEVKGAVAFVSSLKRQKIPTALVTSGERWKVDAVLDQLALEHTFTLHITASDIERGKPNPECYILAAQCLQKAPDRCIVFEDSLSGVKAAVASGALCIGVQPSKRAAPMIQAGAYRVVADFTSVHLDVSSGQRDEDRTTLKLRSDRLELRTEG